MSSAKARLLRTYFADFTVAFFALRWWRMTSRRRPQRFSFAPVLAAGFWGVVLVLLVRPQNWPSAIVLGVSALMAAPALAGSGKYNKAVAPGDRAPTFSGLPAVMGDQDISISLDDLKEDLRKVGERVSTEDRRLLEEHATFVREMEQELKADSSRALNVSEMSCSSSRTIASAIISRQSGTFGVARIEHTTIAQRDDRDAPTRRGRFVRGEHLIDMAREFRIGGARLVGVCGRRVCYAVRSLLARALRPRALCRDERGGK